MADEAPGAPRRIGALPALILLVALVALLPFLVVKIPSMTDLPGHIGRYHVMTAPDADGGLARYYRIDWKLFGNLGVDLIVRALYPLMGVEAAARFASAVIPVLTIAGIATLGRVVHARIEPIALLACCFVFANPFLFGFVNYCLAFALALLVLAAWIGLRERSRWRHVPMLGLLVFVVWLAHAMGWVVLGLLVAGFESERLWQRRRTTLRAGLIDAAIRCLAFMPPALLTLLWREAGSGALFAYGADLAIRKAMNWIVVLRGGEKWSDLGSLIVIGALVAGLLWQRLVRIDWRLANGAILIAIVCTVMPTSVFGSWGADERIAPAAMTVFLLALRWTGSAREGLVLAMIATALFFARTTLLAHDWHALDTAYAARLRALDHVERGSRIHAIVLQDRCHGAWQATAYNHLPGIAILRRDALVNSQWVLPGAALLHVVYPIAPRHRTEPSQLIDGYDCNGPIAAPLRARLAALAPGRWDYVWILRTRGRRDLWPHHATLFGDEDSLLYKATPEG